MSKAETASSEGPEMSRKASLEMTNCFPFTEGKPGNLSIVIKQRKRVSDRIVCRVVEQTGDVATETFPRGVFCRGLCLHWQGQVVRKLSD